MYYLDDFLELLEPFSVQFRDDLKRIGELDEEVKSLQAKLKEKSVRRALTPKKEHW